MRKRIVLAVIMIICLGLNCGCKVTEKVMGEDEEKVMGNDEEILPQPPYRLLLEEVQEKEENQLSKHVTLKVENVKKKDKLEKVKAILSTDENIAVSYGEIYSIQKKENGKWYGYNDFRLFSLVGYLLAPGDKKEIEYEIKDYEMAEGEYRICISIYELTKEQYEKYGTEDNTGKEKTVYGYFHIES